ncbi:uncharacterized protein LOC104906819 [Beta vulgaris subsp. vulgaris]|uniref:uncharacterized protein LOC104906819 n=1 Tax=Beta vulgaris subsp. vulgaris TaxID=3555 RepID=UPI002036B859|nr:uncharacterized protein LOC104906819 [Beta vulgaris subsp. vulgaris]XP_048503650.1 uncharacterized protein LOC104906819 [Beta vulgaris subsp. vulgaris]
MDTKDQARHNRLLRRFILIQRRNRATNLSMSHNITTNSRPKHLPIRWTNAPMPSRLIEVQRAHQPTTLTGETSKGINSEIGSSTPTRRRTRTDNRESTSSSRRRVNSQVPPDETMMSTNETQSDTPSHTPTTLTRVDGNTQQTTTEQGETSTTHVLLQRKYTTPWNFGGPKHFCLDCGARVWIEERVKRERAKDHPKYNICCQKGKVRLPLLKEPPQYLKSLLDPNSGTSTKFKDCIRAYNSIFAFTSMGGEVDRKINRGRGPYIFRILGQNYHKIGSLLPPDGEQPRFTQLYVHDPSNEVRNRISSLTNNAPGDLDPQIVEGLSRMLDEHNELAKVFRMAKERFSGTDMQPVQVRLIATRSKDGRQYNLPSSNELAALIVGNNDNERGPRDVIVEEKSHRLQRISENHPSFMALQYPLLFPYGEDGYRIDIPHNDSHVTTRKKKTTVTMREYYAFRFMERLNEARTLILCGRLRQQLIVDAFTCLQQVRLDFIRNNQTTIRKDVLCGLTDSVSRGDTTPASIGRRVVLPSSFTGGPRYMVQNYQDAMAICRWAGPPDLFITFTCNPKWQEITEFLASIPGQRPEDRPDVVARVFKIKLDELICDLTVREHFGKTLAVIYTIEFQKRGLPHAHILLFLDSEDKPSTPEDIDKIISAELPDPKNDHLGYEIVVQSMMHGPCGSMNEKSPCMQNGQCSKYYPKSFQAKTTLSEEGYPIYMRRDNGQTATKNGQTLDNRSVIPYNIDLLVKFQAHINVEWCNKDQSLKYLFKYMNKGPDMALARIEQVTNNDDGRTHNEQEEVIDEIKDYLKCRYVSASEACWRIFAFNIQYKDPPVQRLTFHLENHQEIIFEDHERLDDVLERVGTKKTTLTEWMTANKEFEEAHELTYVDFPTKWVWVSEKKKWKKRELGRSIGRIYFAHPAS